MMRTERIPEGRVVERAVLAVAITMTMARVRRTRRAVRTGPGKVREQRSGRGNERGRGRETVKGKILLNKPKGEMISLMPLLCSCRRKGMRENQTRRAK